MVGGDYHTGTDSQILFTGATKTGVDISRATGAVIVSTLNMPPCAALMFSISPDCRLTYMAKLR